ncbi:MAG: hypothetical protein HYX32_09925 [Actinobacteria bacterium]|nr:hypothetical protein [Actinomycetota bacterium]
MRLVRQLRAELGTEHGTVKRVADQLGYSVESVRSWARQADIDTRVKPGLTSEEAEQIKKLEQELKELRRANEILRRAAAFMRLNHVSETLAVFCKMNASRTAPSTEAAMRCATCDRWSFARFASSPARCSSVMRTSGTAAPHGYRDVRVPCQSGRHCRDPAGGAHGRAIV